MTNEMKMLELLPSLISTFADPIHFLELGCNDGYHTGILVRHLAASGKTWRYVAVEADPRLNGCPMPAGVEVFRGAVGEHDGEATLHLSGGQSETGMRYTGSSSLRPPTEETFKNWPRMTFNQSVTVPTLCLDSLVSNYGLAEWLDFVWCDIQGCEGDAIRGGPGIIPKTKWIFLEYSEGALYEGQAVFQDIQGILAPHFDLYRDFGGDALFRHKALRTGTEHTEAPAS